MIDTNEFNEESVQRAVGVGARSFLKRHNLPLTASEDLATLLGLMLRAGEMRSIAPLGSEAFQYADLAKRNPEVEPHVYKAGLLGAAIALIVAAAVIALAYIAGTA